MVEEKKVEGKDIQWITTDSLIKKDEKVMIQTYRFVKSNWKLFVGMFIGALITWLVMK